jgi:hypothetical protein
MKLISILFLCFFSGIIANGQNIPIKQMISPAMIDTNFVDTLTFNEKWDYPWYIVYENGVFENTFGETIEKSDTAHLFYTANCWTNHQGEHQIRYCQARYFNDTITLFFMPELPAYASSLTVSIVKNDFWCDFTAVYPESRINQKLTRTITNQKLILNYAFYKPGDMVKGYVEVTFTETSIVPNEMPVSQSCYFKGFFKTQLMNP